MMRKADIAIVGAGPAGLGAATAAATRGCRVVVLDMNPQSGGQLIKQTHKFFGSRDHCAGIRGVDIASRLFEEAQSRGVDVLTNQQASYINGNTIWTFGTGASSMAAGDESGSSVPRMRVEARKVILATGGVENTATFPGWTLPGVMGAGAAQTMANLWRIVPGRRILMVGAGNVGLIVSYQLMQAGARVMAVVEARDRVGGYAVHASKLMRAGTPILLQHTVVRALGRCTVEGAEIAQIGPRGEILAGTTRTLDVDTVCIAVGLRPNARLAALAGCSLTFSARLGGWVPMHDADMRTTVQDIYVAGDVTGIEEASTALEEGRLAGILASADIGHKRAGDEEAVREIQMRLSDLRGGPFGAGLSAAKEEVHARKAGHK